MIFLWLLFCEEIAFVKRVEANIYYCNFKNALEFQLNDNTILEIKFNF